MQNDVLVLGLGFVLGTLTSTLVASRLERMRDALERRRSHRAARRRALISLQPRLTFRDRI